MHLITRKPVLNSLSSLFDDAFFNPSWPSFPSTTSTLPAVNVREEEKEFQLELASPGFKKADFQIEIENDTLTVSAGVQEKDEQTQNAFTLKEFNYSAFQRAFHLPDTINVDQIKANYADGILTIFLPKREEALPQPVTKIVIE